MAYLKNMGAGLFIVLGIALVISTDTALVPKALQTPFEGLQGFFVGANWASLLDVEGGGARVFALLTIGVWSAALLSMLLGRFVLRPLFQLLPKVTLPAPPPAMDRLLKFIQPPDPPKTIKGRPFMEAVGIPLAAFMHVMPPPGPWAIRMFIAVVFGATSIAVWRFAIGSLIGIAIHLGAVVAIVSSDLSLPAPPGGLKGLVLTITTPIVLTIVVRSALVLARIVRRGSRPA